MPLQQKLGFSVGTFLADAAFSYYESQTGQPISRAVAEYLGGD